MSYSPEMVNIFIPLMKNLNMSWEELKRTPRRELIGLLTALSEYNILHSFDGYTIEECVDKFKNMIQKIEEPEYNNTEEGQ